MARLEVAPTSGQIIVVPYRFGACPGCGNEVTGEVHLRVGDGFEFPSDALDTGVRVDMSPVGARVAHDCVPGPAR